MRGHPKILRLKPTGGAGGGRRCLLPELAARRALCLGRAELHREAAARLLRRARLRGQLVVRDLSPPPPPGPPVGFRRRIFGRGNAARAARLRGGCECVYVRVCLRVGMGGGGSSATWIWSRLSRVARSSSRSAALSAASWSRSALTCTRLEAVTRPLARDRERCASDPHGAGETSASNLYRGGRGGGERETPS